MQDPVFDKNGHIGDLGVSHYVDALRSGKTAELPRELIAHVEECMECKKAILQLHAILSDPESNQDDTIPKRDKPGRNG